jgi:hypothetical protein
MNQLEPCPHCHRHVSVSETSCPFCDHSLADAFANRAPRIAPRVRLGRAATFAFGVLAMTQGACSDDDNRTPPPDAAMGPTDAGPDAGIPSDADYDGGVPIYASAPTPHAGTTSRG